MVDLLLAGGEVMLGLLGRRGVRLGDLVLFPIVGGRVENAVGGIRDEAGGLAFEGAGSSLHAAGDDEFGCLNVIRSRDGAVLVVANDVGVDAVVETEDVRRPFDG